MLVNKRKLLIELGDLCLDGKALENVEDIQRVAECWFSMEEIDFDFCLIQFAKFELVD